MAQLDLNIREYALRTQIRLGQNGEIKEKNFDHTALLREFAYSNIVTDHMIPHIVWVPSVLLFPPVNNFRRFLIHQTCENFRQKYDLFTFSVGQGPFRRTVICFKNQLLDPHKYTETAAAANFETRNKHIAPPVKSWRSDNRRIETSNSFSNNIIASTINKRDRKMGVEKNTIDAKLNKSNPGDLYRPPALRNHNGTGVLLVNKTNQTTTTSSTTIETIGEVCAATSSIMSTITTTPTSPTATTTATTSISCNNSPIHRNENVNNHTIKNSTMEMMMTTTSTQQNTLQTMEQQQQQQLQQQQVDEQHQQKQQQETHQPQRQLQQQQQQQQPSQSRRERRPDRAVYIPRARRSQTTPPNTANTTIQQQLQTPPPHQPPLSAQQSQQQHQQRAPTITGNTTTTILANHTSKSLSQQLAITYDDTTSASVNQKPSSKADEVGKLLSGGYSYNNNSSSTSTSTSNNISTTTITKKKEKLSKENKESREQRREQRLLKKSLSTTNATTTSSASNTTSATTISSNHISKNNLKFCEKSNNVGDENVDNNESIQTVIVNNSEEKIKTPPSPPPPVPLQPSPLINNLNQVNSGEFDCNYENNKCNEHNNLNIFEKSKVVNCDSDSEISKQQQKQQIQNLTNSQQQQQQQQLYVIQTKSDFDSLEQIKNIEINDSLLNEFNNKIPQLVLSENIVEYHPARPDFINCVNNTSSINNIIVNTTNIVISNNNSNNTSIMPKKSTKSTTNKILSTGMMDNNLRIEDVAPQLQQQQQQLQPTKKCDIEEQELQRASKEINRSNRRIMKQTFVSDILQIPDYIDEEDNEAKTQQKSISASLANNIQRTNQIDSNTEEEEEEEEDDWENMYSESGECLDPKIMQELTASVGKCKIELPKMDYSAYLTKQSILNEEEFPHVLEVSNFPVEFKNQDLLMVFSQYKESGFDIKWVDDTHALAVFSSSRIAAEVLTMGHPFVVLKPLAEATIESRMKAKKCAASLQPYRPRPQTCAALARRLVSGALGVRLKTAAAERENEKRVLHEAKERKLLAAKQRDEVWES